jgi:hypothetical protein
MNSGRTHDPSSTITESEYQMISHIAPCIAIASSGSGLVSRASPVQSVVRNCTGDEGEPELLPAHGDEFRADKGQQRVTPPCATPAEQQVGRIDPVDWAIVRHLAAR